MSAFRRRLELAEERLRHALADLRCGLDIPADAEERERCRVVAERVERKAAQLAVLLAPKAKPA